MARPSSRGAASRTVPAALRRGGIVRFFSETVAELRKAVWPSRSEVVRLTYIVLVISAIVGFLLGSLDFGLTQTFTRFVIR